MKNAVIYARYSSDRQNEMSIEGQLRECRSYAQKNDMLVIEEYIDRAQTATTDKRPNFLRMIQDSENRTFEVILVYQLDRFARNKNDSGYYKKILSNNGVRVISAKEQIASDSSGVITEGMLEIVADWFSKQLSEKVTRGMMQNAEKCKYNGGTMTFGYTVDNDGHYILDEQRAPIVKEIFERIANGETAASICADLNRRGIRTIKGNVFVKNSLQNMIRNEKYKGIYSFGGVRVPDGMPRIVSDELFDEVQDALEHRSSMTRPVSDNYLLTGKLYCGYCTKPMIGTSGTSKTGKVHRYYICQNTIGKVKKCDKRSVRKDFIESQVISICLASLTDDIIDTVVDSVVAQNNIDQESPELVRLRAEIKAIEKKIDELIDQVEAGVHSPRFARRLEEREAELETLKKQKRIEELLDNIKPGSDSFAQAIGLACVYNAYSKRKTNLSLIDEATLPKSNRELFLALSESARFLKCCGIEAAATGEEYSDIPLSDIHDIYDTFESVIEAYISVLKRMTVSILSDGIRIVMEATGKAELPGTILPVECKESDGLLFFTVRVKDKGGDGK